MSGRYEIWLTNDYGLRLILLDDILDLSASRIVDGIGQFNGTFKKDFDTSFIKPDFMIQVWRAPRGGRLSLWRPYFIREWRYQTLDGEEHINIEGPCINDLLRRRIVAAYSGTSYARKTDLADDMMKEIVTESMSDAAPPIPTAGTTRAWADLSVAPQFGLGPNLEKSFAYDHLLYPSGAGLLPAIAEDSRMHDVPIYFDIVPHVVHSDSINFQFRTYVDQPGKDLAGEIVFDQELGNLSSPFLEFDHTEEENYIYAGGRMPGLARTIYQVSYAARFEVSQWNRCEGFADARNQAVGATNEVREAAYAALDEGRPRRRLGGIPLDTQGTRFGRDWDWGDRITARYRGQEFDALVDVVAITLNRRGQERIQSRLYWED